MRRQELLARLTERILRVQRDHPVRVAIDGVSAAGKTTLADEIVAALASQPRQVIRASIDDFHNPPDVRYRLGRMSPEGYYLDTFDHEAIKSTLLLPLGPGGFRRYRIGAYGQSDGGPAAFEEHTATEDAIALIDGVFLFRPELNDAWDYRIFVAIDPAVALQRGLERDAGRTGSREEAALRYQQRYVPGERIYLETVRPWEHANAIVHNDHPASPVLEFRKQRSSGLRAWS